MKKMFALVLALMIAMMCMSASADTVYTKLDLNDEVVKELLAGNGVPEDQLEMFNPIVKLVNALGVNVITVEDGCQIDLDLNGTVAISLGVSADDEGLALASSLFPNFVVTAKQETLTELMSSVPVAGAATSGVDPQAMMDVFGKYVTPWMETCMSAGQPGEPVTGDYVFDGFSFNTMVPVTVDIPAIAEATKTMMADVLADPAAMAMLQAMAQSSGETVDEATLEEGIKAAFDEWMAHFPQEASAEVYLNDDGSESFYMTAEAQRETDGPFTAYMLYVDGTNMSMGYQDGETSEGGFAMEGTDMGMYYQAGEMYFGLSLSFPENQFAASLFVMNNEKPLLSVYSEIAQGGERTLSMDAEGKTVLTVEEVMSDETGTVMQGILGDFMGTGLGELMGIITSEVPEIAELMNLMSAQ